MSDGYFNENPGRALRSWALYQMLAGAGWGAIFTVAIAAILLAIWGVSLLLPAASKEAPSPYQSSIMVIERVVLV
jgi:Intrinsic membrane protein PufX